MSGAPVRVVGVLSGTSVDAIDVAVADLHLDGEVVQLDRLGERTVPLPVDLRAALLAALPPATTTSEAVCRLDVGFGRAFGAAARDAIATLAGGHADLVGVLGQTLHHDVVDGAVHGTLQLGQPAEVAEATGSPVVADLRARDVAAGGQGAPLVSALDVLLLAEHAGDGPVAAANLGGIANLTVVAPGSAPVAFDCGPANAWLDVAAERATGRPYDADGTLAAAGRVDGRLLEVLLDDPFLAAPWPKTTGKERYHAAELDRRLTVAPVGDPGDLQATLTEAVAVAVADHAARAGVRHLWASGGGVRNHHLVARLRHHLAAHGCGFAPTDELGLPVDAKEAYAVALLAWCTWVGLPATVPSCTGARGPRLLGSVTPGVGPLAPPPVTGRPTRLRIGASVASTTGGTA